MKPLSSLCALASLLAVPAGGEILERVVAKVNGDIVTLSEFEARQVAALQAARVGPESVERYLRENNARILQEAVDDLLLVQRGRELGVKVRPEYVNDIVEGIKKDNGIATDAQFQEQLHREGLSLEELKRNIERSILRRQVLNHELESKAAVSETEARGEYEAHKERYTKRAAAHLQEIVVEGEGAAERAAALVAQARAGEDFAGLARENSAGPTAKDGGDLGLVAHDDLAPDLQRVSSSLKPGEVCDPLRAPRGYRILKLVERTEATVTPFDQARAEIVQQLTQERMAKAYEGYIAGLRKSSAGAIEIRVREVPLQVTVPEQPQLVVPPAPGATAATPSAAAPGAASAPRAPGAAAEGEFVTTPQERPERVAPEPAPGASPEKEEPAPQPSPPPGA